MNYCIINKIKQMSERPPLPVTNSKMGEISSKRQKTEDTEEQEMYYFVENRGHTDKTGVFHGEEKDQIANRYEISKPLGNGAFAICYLVFDHKTKTQCALKIIRRDKRFQRQAEKEYEILKRLNGSCSYSSENVPFIRMIEYMEFDGHPIFTFEILGDNLYSVLKYGGFSGFPQEYTHSYVIEILKCLEILKRLEIVHADLKPENILLKSEDFKDGVKVIDFGSSCFAHQKAHNYIQSRYYRAAEVVLGCGYNWAIDMWSLGCIIVELHSGKPLFTPKNEKHLIVLIFELLGMPTDEFLASSERSDEFFGKDKPHQYYDKNGRPHILQIHTIADACKTQDPDFIDFVSQCICWDPEERMTPEEALVHPYITKQKPIVSHPIPHCSDFEEEEPEFPGLP